jgi:hypothetical protein
MFPQLTQSLSCRSYAHCWADKSRYNVSGVEDCHSLAACKRHGLEGTLLLDHTTHGPFWQFSASHNSITMTLPTTLRVIHVSNRAAARAKLAGDIDS